VPPALWSRLQDACADRLMARRCAFVFFQEVLLLIPSLTPRSEPGPDIYLGSWSSNPSFSFFESPAGLIPHPPLFSGPRIDPAVLHPACVHRLARTPALPNFSRRPTPGDSNRRRFLAICEKAFSRDFPPPGGVFLRVCRKDTFFVLDPPRQIRT